MQIIKSESNRTMGAQERQKSSGWKDQKRLHGKSDILNWTLKDEEDFNKLNGEEHAKEGTQCELRLGS